MPKSQTVHALNGKAPKNGGDKWASTLAQERSGNLTWRDADAEDLLAALVAVTEDGAALLLSRTSDGGALAVHVLAGGATHKLYPASMAQLTETLRLISDIANTP